MASTNRLINELRKYGKISIYKDTMSYDIYPENLDKFTGINIEVNTSDLRAFLVETSTRFKLGVNKIFDKYI